MNLDPRIDRIPCFFHDVIEPIIPGSIRCLECCHVYNSPEDLIEAELREWSSMWVDRTPTVEDIHCCPMCLHDW